MQLTPDEKTVLIEALRALRVRVSDAPRRVLCEALIYRMLHALGGELETPID